MKRVLLPLLVVLFLAGCGQLEMPSAPAARGQADSPPSLTEARRGFRTKLVRQTTAGFSVPEPPARLFRTVRYDAPAGKLAAYLGVPPGDGKKRPAILWLFGGFSNSIGPTAWQAAPRTNDQSASAFRKAGVLMMYPSLRGGNDNPGFQEAFFGEVDDVVAAADYLARQDFVDPARIYLGGHSTGGTLALLVAAVSDRFRAVFSFGPVDDVAGYGPKYLPFDLTDAREVQLRAPVRWLHSIRSPVFIFEGNGGNIESLRALAAASRNPLVHTYPINGANHFNLLAPLTRLVAGKILRDEGARTNVTFTDAELRQALVR